MRKILREEPPLGGGGLPPILRAADLEERGIPRGHLRGMVRRGEVERIDRGLYQLGDDALTEHFSLAAVCKRIPGAIVCLVSALDFHGIGTQIPRATWIALDRKARKPKPMWPPFRVVRFSGPMLRYGIETRETLGVPFRITSPARTVVDCFRYRNKVGIDVALEAVTDALRSRLTTIDQVMRAAEVCRIKTVMLPYLMGMVV